MDALMDAFALRFDGGLLRLYDDAGQVLAELRFGRPAFYRSVAGTIAARAVEQDTGAANTGTATSYRAIGTDGTLIVEGTVGPQDGEGYDLELPTPDIVIGSIVGLISCFYSYPLE